MNSVHLCPICLQQSVVVQSAIISPWVRQLGSIKERKSKYQICLSCESGFFDYRYSKTELDGIYTGYRGPHYLSVRQHWEPSYTSELNSALGHDPNVLSIRHEFVLSALDQGLSGEREAVRTVVDVGGDRGQFIPPEFPNKYVLDVSGNELFVGVERLWTNAEAEAIQPDLIMACGILEHLPEPFAFINDLASIGGRQRRLLVYIEVPSGVPSRRNPIRQICGMAVAALSSRNSRLWSYVDNRTSALNRNGRGSSIMMPMRQSEHINFFSMKGLIALASRCQATVRLIDEVEMPSALLSNGRIQFSRSLRMLVEVTQR